MQELQRGDSDWHQYVFLWLVFRDDGRHARWTDCKVGTSLRFSSVVMRSSVSNALRCGFPGTHAVNHMTMEKIFDQEVCKVDATWCSLCSNADHVQTFGQLQRKMVGAVL